MEQLIFSFTFLICLMNLLTVLSVLCNRQLRWPKISKFIGPNGFIFAYPSMMYQAWHWSPTLMGA